MNIAVRLGVLVSLVVSALAVNARADDVDRLAGQIDQHIQRKWSEAGIKPTSAGDEAEFMRRVYLDIAGKIPPVSELRTFLDDDSPSKRRELVDRLLESPNYIRHFTQVWRTAMMPEADADIQVRFLVPSFESWLRNQLAENTPYNEMVREILTVPMEFKQGFNPYSGQYSNSPVTFYQAKQLKPENLAAGIARTFLGVRIECAQCHDHPYDTWKRTDFWSFAAFFAGFEKTGTEQQGIFGGVRELTDRRELFIPDSDTVVQAAYLDGSQPKWKFRTGPRQTLADWVTSDENPYFARAAVNRLWAHFFGTGIVDAVDDFGDNNPPSHPELLDELAAGLISHDFDLHFIIRAITTSKTYGLTSSQTDPSQADPRMFARARIRGLTANQLFNSLAQATGHFERFSVRNDFDFTGQSPRTAFNETFSDDVSTSEAPQVGILQSLAMMNGKLTADATDLEKSATLTAIVDFPLASTEKRIEALYLAALSRQPRADELTDMAEYVESGGPKQDRGRALADVFWALLNSSEFMFNH